MALPAQVEQDLKEIEELEKHLAAQEAAEVDTEAETEETVDEIETQDERPSEVAQEEPVSQDEPREDFEHKYRTLQGKYDAEVPRLHSQVRELMQKVEDLSKAPAPEPEKQPEPQSYVTDADRENFGEDLLDVQRRVAQEVGAKYESQIAKLEGTITNLQTQLEGTNSSVNEMSFEQRLNRLVPDFGEINKNPKWIAWLDEIDPIIRGPRRMMAQKAFADGDVEAVADYVSMWKAGQAPKDEPTPRQTELERQVTPSRNTAPTTPTQQAQSKVYSEAEMNAAWDKVTVWNKAGRYDEADKLEAELSAALIEGRVR